MPEQRATERVPTLSIDVIRSAYAAAGAGDREQIMDIVDPQIVVRDRPESPDPRTYHGHAGVRQALASSDESFEGFELRPEEFIAEGEYVIVVLRMRGTGRGSGVPVEERIAHQWKVRGGKVVALQVYSDPADAVRDARLGR